MNKKEAFKIGLPKWAQCVIEGKSICEEQALEIIRRTDGFFLFGSGGNDETFDESAKKIVHMPDYHDCDNYSEKKDQWDKEWGCLNIGYLANDWVSSCALCGPNGWCNPDGTIYFNHNIGKWPSVEDVYRELQIIAKEFPFLDMTCTIMNGDYYDGGNSPLISMYVANGKVSILDTPKTLSICSNKDMEEDEDSNPMSPPKETTFDLSQLEKWAKEVYGK